MVRPTPRFAPPVCALVVLGALAAAAPVFGQAALLPPRDAPPNGAALSLALPVEPASDQSGPATEQPAKEPKGKKNPPATETADQAKPPDEAPKDKEKKEDKEPWYSVHGQGTVVSQGNWKFHSPYEGPNSFRPQLSMRTTETATLFLAARVWQGGEIVFDPEISGGRGLSDTLGMGGFPNGEATRVGVPEPTPYIARLLLRQTFELDGPWEKLEDAPNQIAGHRDLNRITIQVGRMASTDLFDNNTYSHDPRTQFLNWSLMYNGAWDYPANVRGYTYGATVEMNQPIWAVRYGVFAEPTVANGASMDPHFLKANGHALELEYRWGLDELPGKVRFLSFLNNAHMGNYRVALREMPVDPDITQTRAYRVKYGFGLNVEQQLSADLGVFARLGWDDGHTETWAFTEIDESLSLGLQLKGKSWGRPQDVVGLAAVVNGLSTGHRDYLAAGGVGFIVGDGRLHYGAEEILETYYSWAISKMINVTLDLQGVNNPAYNRDRGPVGIAGLRVHFEF